jgi:coenzyme F420-0:L-glutamate ligase/coenzyme F420-1:gamma-L-glutamate ligase
MPTGRQALAGPPEGMQALEAIAGRRSLRRFAPRRVPRALLRDLVAAACAAPAPHRSRPWRFVEITPEARPRLAEAMAAAWRADLEADRQPLEVIERSLARSRRQLVEAPLLLLACLEQEGARRWPDRRRRRAERDMYMQSLGAALQNLLLAAHARGLGGYLKGAPLFCQAAVEEALGLPTGWQPAFLVLLGYPAEGFRPPPRPAIRPDDFLIER